MDDFCEACSARIPPSALACEYCGTLTKDPPLSAYLLAIPAAGVRCEVTAAKETPLSAYLLAIGIGVIVPGLIIFVPALSFRLLPNSIGYGIFEIVVILVGIFVLIPITYYRTGCYMGSKWPDTSPWTWSFCVMCPFAILALKQGYILGLLFILPGYYGAKKGKKRALDTSGGQSSM